MVFFTARGRSWLKIMAGWLLLGVLIIGAVLAWLWQQQQRFVALPLGVDDVSVVIEPGDSFITVLSKLRGAGVLVGHDWQWQWLAYHSRTAVRLKTGEYALTAAMTPPQLLQHMALGKTTQYRVTLVEGWNFSQVRQALRRAPKLKQTLETLSDAQIMAKLGEADQHPEGRFLPETYVYQRGDSDVTVLQRAHDAMQQALDDAWENRADNLPLANKDELLILASIIEKETGVAHERPEIAGVFIRRLQRGMRLQTDPTVIYGLGAEWTGRLRRSHLTTDTPYNTYTRAGLPPTPIALPGKAALQAAAHPANGNALYFVAAGDGQGGHVFSATLEEHNAAVRRYLQRQRAQSQRP